MLTNNPNLTPLLTDYILNGKLYLVVLLKQGLSSSDGFGVYKRCPNQTKQVFTFRKSKIYQVFFYI